MIFIAIFVGGLLLYAVVRSSVYSAGITLQNKFHALGPLEHKSLDEIRAAVGDPVATAAVGNGRVLYQWAETGFRVAILFEGQRFDGITSIYGGTVS